MSARRLFAGASGYSFKEWRGTFYPEKLKPEEMLAFYSARLPSVEINNTFYRMPKTEVLRDWAAITPPDFRFAIKAPRRITHDASLKADIAAASVRYLYEVLENLGTKRGPVLFQLPPSLKKDLPRLDEFLALLPQGHLAAFEFRNDSWFADEVYASLRKARAALALSEREDSAPSPLIETAPWGYVRLRREDYSDDDLARWAERLLATGWGRVHVYFKHELMAPGYAKTLLQRAAQAPRTSRLRGSAA